MKAPDPRNPLVIVYHADCIDGVASAWIMTKALKAEQKDVAYIPYAHHAQKDSESAIIKAAAAGADLYFVDVAPENNLLDSLAASPARIRILDHHKSAWERLKDYSAPNLDIFFDTESNSAAKMIWQKTLPSAPVPDIIELIDLMDGDGSGLETQAHFAAAETVDRQNISTPENALHAMEILSAMSFDVIAEAGMKSVEQIDHKIDTLFQKACTAPLEISPGAGTVDVPILNGDVRQYGRKISRRLAELGRKSGTEAAFIWSLQKNGSVSMSIRTSASLDASKVAAHICKATGCTGGGHADAAAVHFSSLDEFKKHIKIEDRKAAPPEPRKKSGLSPD